MNNIKKIGLLLVIGSAMTGLTQAAKHEGPDATIRLSGKAVAAGIGFSWGKGTLTYKGKDYAISVKGLAVGKVGMTGVSAYGEVHNLKHLKDFNGHYHAGGAGRRGVTLASGRNAVAMTNDAGVTVLLASRERGVDVNLGGSGVDMKLK
jgi:hypothetical protein